MRSDTFQEVTRLMPYRVLAPRSASQDTEDKPSPTLRLLEDIFDDEGKDADELRDWLTC